MVKNPAKRFPNLVMFREVKIKQKQDKILYIFQLTKLHLISIQGAGSVFG